MKKVSLSVAARAFVAGQWVYFSTGEATQSLAPHTFSVRKARKILMFKRYCFNASGFYLRE